MNCMHCGDLHDVVLTVEHRGVLAHYHACFAHIEMVADRLRGDVGAPAIAPVRTNVIEATTAPAMRQIRR